MSDEKIPEDKESIIARLWKRARSWAKQMKEPPTEDKLQELFNNGTPEEINEALLKMIDEDNDKYGGGQPLYKGITF